MTLSILLASFSALGCGAAAPASGGNAVPSGGGLAATVTTTTPAAPAAAAAAAADGKEQITFVVQAPGSQRVERESSELELDVVLTDGDRIVQSEARRDADRIIRHVTVLANDGAAVTKKKVRYDEKVKTTRKGERELRTPSPLTGKTYVLAFEKGIVVVTSPGGDPVSDIERDAALADSKNLGKSAQFASFLPKRALAPGEKFSPPPEALMDLFGGEGEGKSFGDIEFTFVGGEERAGNRVHRFDFSMTITDKREGMTTEIRTKGTALLRVDTGWPLELSLGGQVTVAAPGETPSQKISGKGVLKKMRATQYE